MNILIVDDHKLFRSLLAKELENVTKETILLAENGRAALNIVGLHPIEIIFLDVAMPVMNGYETCLELKKNYPDVKIIILTQFGQQEVFSWFIQREVNGIVSKSISIDEMILAIKTIRSGHRYFSEDIRENIFDMINNVTKFSARLDFDDRERKIVHFLHEGMSTKEIAVRMNLKIKSIDFYREQLLRKTNSRNTVELVSFSITRGLIN